MTFKERIKHTLKTGSKLKNTTYQRMGLAKHKNKVDISLFLMFMLCATTFPFFISKPAVKTTPVEECSSPAEIVENIHEDFGDEPVISAKQASLDELEKKVQLGELSLVVKTLEKGDSLLGILSAEKVPTADRLAVVEALEVIIDLKSLRPGMSFMLFKATDDTLHGVSIQIKEGETLAAVREADDSWTPITATGRIETENIRMTGTVEKTFSGSAQKVGISESIIAQVISALDGEVDFSTDINPGDTFDVIFETKKTSAGLEIGTKQLLFVGLKTQQKEYYRYAFTNASGTTSFYNAKGRSGEKVIIKKPLKARPRLSSSYGKRRHPILMYEIFHHGVDLAAPTNTPIQAGADGVITQLGRKGGYGKYIRVKHADNYETAYAHMNGYRQDLKVGSRVKRGEVIGYVGSTGRSTGPHLHYEVIKGGKTVDPLGKNVISAKVLKDFELEQFISMAEGLHPDFARHRAGKIPPVPSVSPFNKK